MKSSDFHNHAFLFSDEAHAKSNFSVSVYVSKKCGSINFQFVQRVKLP